MTQGLPLKPVHAPRDFVAARLSVHEAGALLERGARTVQRWCRDGRLPCVATEGNGGEAFSIAVTDLPEPAQARYFAQQLKQTSPADRREALVRLNLEEQQEREVARLAGVVRRPRALLPVSWSPEESVEASDALIRSPHTVKDEAFRRLAILNELRDLEGAGMPKLKARALVAEQHHVSEPTLGRWVAAVRGLPENDHLAALAPRRGKVLGKGGRQAVELDPDAWAFVLTEWLVQSQPDLASVYRRLERRAEVEGWAIPSIKTIQRRLDKLPSWQRTIGREGREAQAKRYPDLLRDYSDLALHESWCSDGRKADVFCRWPDGTVGRPVIVGWEDLRSRRLLGYAVGKTESSDLVRLSFRDAAERSAALPSEVLVDNGRAYASKLITGGQPNRYRFKVKDEEVPGILTLLSVRVRWATPGRGQSKPIESFWRTTAAIDRRAEFAGAYCGNRPDAKPEEFDARKAIPIELYLAALAEDIDAYNARPHRGDSMDGRSPDQVYAHLIESTPVRSPTREQLRLCLMAAESVRRDKGGGVWILKNRYWSEALSDLADDGPFVVRFNPENAEEPVQVYRDAEFVCSATLVLKGGWKSTALMSEHNRGRNQYTKAKRQQYEATQQMLKSRNWTDTAPSSSTGIAIDLPRPKAVEPVRPAKDYRPRPARPEPSTEEAEFARMWAAGVDRQMEELRKEEPRAANGY